MKKTLFVLVTMLLANYAMGASTFTVTTPSGHTIMCYYDVIGHNGEVGVGQVSGQSYSGTLIIPDSVSYGGVNYPVTFIARKGSLSYIYTDMYGNHTGYYTTLGFWGLTGLTSLILPSSITEIGSESFRGCTGLTSISLGSNLTTIENYAFQGCSSLLSLTIPNTVTYIGSYAFGYCSSLQGVTLSANANIGVAQFQYCTALTSIIIPGDIASIGEESFYGCTGLNTVTIQNGVTSIGNSAFFGCSNLSQISIPNSVTSIGQSAFSGCISLQNLVLPNALSSISNGMCQNCTSLENVTIPNTVAYIQSNAFSGCTNIFSVTVPNSVLSIESSAFGGVFNVVYNGSATGATWGAYAVNGFIQDSILYSDNTMTTLLRAHPRISSANIPPSVTTISANAFQNCTAIDSLTIGSNISSIGNDAFVGCTGLTSLNFNTNAECLFPGCTSLTSVTLGSNVTTIGNNMFYGCSSLTNLTLGSNITSIGSNAFYGCSGLTSLTLGSNITSIGSNAFAGCTGLTTLNYNSSVEYSFQNCYSLTNVTLGSNVTTIYNNMFNGCTGLANLTLGNNITTIGSNAFYNCTGLTSLILGSNITFIGSNAFAGCTGLTSLNYNTTAGCSFQGCTSLTNVTFGSNVTSITDNMFNGCSGLSSVSLPNSIQTIGQNAFRSAGITSVDIPSSCTSIGNYAFYGCPLAMVVAEPVTPPSLGSSALSSNPLIYIPCGTYSVYYNMWYQYRNNLFEPTVEFVLNVLASEGGQAYATSEISCVDSTATISATNDYGYHFEHWIDGNTDNPRTIHVTSDTTVTAIFARNSYTITLSSSNETMGSTNGSGTYLYGDTATLMAVPIDHYHFMRWRTTNYYGYETSIHENPYNLVVTNDMVLTADFAIDTYYVNVIPNEVTRGSVTGGGYAEYGQPITVSATPYSGYQFVRWSNGAEYNPYTFAVTNDMTLEAVFMEEGTVYHVEATSDNSVMGTVTGGGPYATGETAVLTAVAYPGYHFVRWQDNVTDNPRSYLVTQDATFVAYFEANVGIVNINNPEIIMYAKDYQIHIDKAFGQDVSIYTIDGRTIASLPRATEQVAIPVTTTGVYIVKIGNHPARKVVVIR